MTVTSSNGIDERLNVIKDLESGQVIRLFFERNMFSKEKRNNRIPPLFLRAILFSKNIVTILRSTCIDVTLCASVFFYQKSRISFLDKNVSIIFFKLGVILYTGCLSHI